MGSYGEPIRGILAQSVRRFCASTPQRWALHADRATRSAPAGARDSQGPSGFGGYGRSDCQVCAIADKGVRQWFGHMLRYREIGWCPSDFVHDDGELAVVEDDVYPDILGDRTLAHCLQYPFHDFERC